MSQTESSQVSKASRRELSIIYFIDSNKTRTLRIPISRVNWILVGGALLFIWLFVSSFAVVMLQKENSELTSELKVLMNNLFDYQTRYDGVYEDAYPSPEKIALQNNVGVKGQKKLSKALAIKEVRNTTAKKNEKMAIRKLAKKSSQNVARGVLLPGKALKIQNIKFSKTTMGTNYSFSFINGGNIKERGRIWGVAEFVDASGKSHFIASPKTVNPTNLKTVKNPEMGHWYSIRRFKKQSLSFDTTLLKRAKLKRLTLGILTNDNMTGIVEVNTKNNQLMPFK